MNTCRPEIEHLFQFNRQQKWNGLTELEKLCLRYYLDGYSYLDIAKLVGEEKKAIDNALQRVRRKFRT